MKIHRLSDLYNMNYNADNIISIMQTRDVMSFFNCIGTPKITHLFLYLDSCRGLYTTKDGKKIYAKSGDIVYCPIGSEYSVSFYDFKNSEASTIGINFMLYDQSGEQFALFPDVTVIDADNANYHSLFHKMVNISLSNPMNFAAHKSVMYRIMNELTEFERRSYESKYSIISKGIAYLEEDNQQDMSISEIAKMCNVSEIYFRKLFKQYSGMTPNEYKINSRIIRAKRYLQSDFSVSEVSEIAGFADTSYFIKIFRSRTGMTPLQYRKRMSKF